MVMSRYLLICSMVTVLTVSSALVGTTAEADDRTCNGFGALSDGPDLTLGRIAAQTPRTFFLRNGFEAKGCPNDTPACRAKAFLVPGDHVIVSGTQGAFVCGDYIGAKGADRAGWLPAEAVTVEAMPPVTTADWTGSWLREEATVDIKPGRRAGEITIKGEATYGSLDPDRVKRGAVNIGDIDGSIVPKGSALSFTMGDTATLPIDKGDDTACKVWMRRLGPFLLVDDNNQCGGNNVTFRGAYRRKG